jgi:hypothetical protein
MARVSRYEQLVGSVVNGVLVSNYVREQRTSKSGRNYTVGRLTVALTSDTTKTINISISSFNKWSFIKRLNKLAKQVVKQVKQTFELVLSKKAQHEQDKVKFLQRDDLDAFRGCETVKEVKNTYKRLAKLFHPDHGGSEEQFKKLQLRYETALIVAEALEDIMAEVEEYRKTGVYEGEVY